MKKLACIALIVVASLPVLAQTTRDRNLSATRKNSDRSTVLPPLGHTAVNGQKDANSQLDKLERQTANTVIQPAAKSPKVPAYKLPSDTRPAAGSTYQQTMPVHAAVKNGAGSANRSSRPGLINSRAK